MSADGLPVGSPVLPTDHARADWVENITNHLLFGVTGTTPEANAGRLAAANAEIAAAAANVHEVNTFNAAAQAAEPESWDLGLIREHFQTTFVSKEAETLVAVDGDVYRAIDARFAENPEAAVRAKGWVAFQNEPLGPVGHQVREMMLGVPGFTPEANRLRSHKADQELTELQEQDEASRGARTRFLRTEPTPEQLDAYDKSVAPVKEPGKWTRPLAVDGDLFLNVANAFAPQGPDDQADLAAARNFLVKLGADPALISEQTRELTERRIDALMLGVNGMSPQSNAVRMMRADAVIRDFEMNPPDPQAPWTERVPVESVHLPVVNARGDVQAAFNATTHDPVAQEVASRILSELDATKPRYWWQRKPEADVVEAQRQDQGSAGRRARMDRVLSDAEQPISSQVPNHVAPRVERGRQL